ncbi:hypothetical protein M885DRAFT_518486 [Pelagophyceae sp. CCMP2097]|nr:hypothetical protein M885DRAFT_518486 [Pelagophyceae sp. CCMP2097]
MADVMAQYCPAALEENPHVTYIDGLLCDAELRLDDCEQQPMLQAFRSAIIAHTCNTLAIGTVLLKLGVMQRDLAERRGYALRRAAETIQRSVAIFETELSKSHSATLKARHQLLETLEQLGDAAGVQAERQAIADAHL